MVDKRGEKMKIENVLKKTARETWHKKQVVFNVNSDTIEVAKLYAEFFIKRYGSEKSGHWKKDERWNTYMGLLGQKIFDIQLQELGVPNDRNDPVIDWRGIKNFDFYIPEIGTVEVKTFNYRHKKVLIKVSEWHSNDYVVVYQFKDSLPKRVNMMGWLTRKQVEKLPISKKGSHFTPIADGYITDFDSLKPAYEFIFKLEKIAKKLAP